MKLDAERIIERFRLFSGEASDGSGPDRDALCRALCGDCARWVEESLREDPGEEPLPGAEALAAAEAFAQLALADQAGSPESVSTPELKLQQGSRARYAAALAQEKRRAAAHLLREEHFYFGEA